MTYIFSELQPSQVPGLWPGYINPGVSEIYWRWRDKVEWEPPEVFNNLKLDLARVIFAYRDRTRIGFIVTRYFLEEFKRTKYMHIWIVYLYPEYRGCIRQVMGPAMEFLRRTAKEDGAQYIEMGTPRLGWQYFIKALKMYPQRTVYRGEI